MTLNGFSTLKSEISAFIEFLYFETVETLVVRIIKIISNFSFVNAARILFIVIKFMRADTVHISCQKLRSRLSTSVVYVIEIELSLHDVPFEFVSSILNKDRYNWPSTNRSDFKFRLTVGTFVAPSARYTPHSSSILNLKVVMSGL